MSSFAKTHSISEEMVLMIYTRPLTRSEHGSTGLVRGLVRNTTKSTKNDMKKCTATNQRRWNTHSELGSIQSAANRQCANLLFVVITLALMPLANSHAQVSNRILGIASTASVRIASAFKLQNPTDMTMEAWVYPTTCALVLSKSDGINVSSDRSYELSAGCNGVGVSFFLGENVWAGCTVSTNPSFIGRWTHLAATFSSAEGRIRLFTNGILAAEATNDWGGTIPLTGLQIRQSSQPVVLGYNPPVGGPAPITLDEVRIWTVARTETEIQQDMYRRLTGTETNLALYWNFDDGTATDLTTNTFNGSFNGMVRSVLDVVEAYPTIATAVEILFQTGNPMTSYQLQRADTVDATNWINLGPPLHGNGGVQSFFDSTRNTSNRFYRVQTH